MNQILFTGENQYIKRTKEKVNTNKNNKLPIKGVMIFFVICLIVLGGIIICGSLYGKYRLNESIEANIKPEIAVTKNDDNTINIIITHKKGLKSASYQWNEDDAVILQTENKENEMINNTIDLPEGINTLKVIAVGVNEQESSITQQYILTKPTIELYPVDNGIQIVASSSEIIEYVQYNWDDGEIQKIEVGEEKYEGIINTPKGKHTLKIEVVNISGEKTEEIRTIVGDTEPTVKIESKLIDRKATFVIDVEDDEKIETIEITHNGGEKQVIEVNEKTYHKEVIMTEGELNTILIKATNLNGLTKTRGVKFNNQ